MKTFKDLKKEVGKELADKLVDVFETKKTAVRWFYHTSILPLGWITPHEAYKKGMKKEVEDEIGRIEHGIYS